MRNEIAIVLTGVLLAGCSTVSTDQPICRVPSQCVGTWLEIEQIGWKDAVVTPTSPIREFVIESDGSFTVTWQPFETYCDFWGTCHFPSGTNTALFYVLSGNHIPKYFDGRGSYRFSEGNLVLDDLFFGHPRAEQNKLEEPVKAIFGHKFKKTGPVPEPTLPAHPRHCLKCGNAFSNCPYCVSMLTPATKCKECNYPTDKCGECAARPKKRKANN